MWTCIWWKRGEYFCIPVSRGKISRKWYKHFHFPIKKKGPYQSVEFLSRPQWLPKGEMRGEWEILSYEPA